MSASPIEQAFDQVFARDIEQGYCDQALYDQMTDTIAACATDKERETFMKSHLDRLFHHPHTLTHQVQGLAERPELDGCAVEVLGPSKVTPNGLQFPVRLRHMHASYNNETLLISPLNLHVLLVGPQQASDSDGDGDGGDINEEDAMQSFSGASLTERCRALCTARGEVLKVSAAACSTFASTIAIDDVRVATRSAESEEEEERTAALLVAWNAINFSYYADEGQPRWRWRAPDGTEHGADDEANGVVAALTALNAGAQMRLADADFLRKVSAQSLREEIFPAAPGAGELPMADERAAALRELGEGLARLGATPRGLVLSAAGSAARFVTILVQQFPTYADIQLSLADAHGSSSGGGGGTHLEFHKRAQLCASMLHGAGVCGGFSDMRELTIFADYRLPQLLRAPDVGIFVLSPRLAAAIDGGEKITRDSEDEIVIRAATVWAGAIIGEALRATEGGHDITQAQLDYYLWKLAVRRDAAGELPAFHRTRCTAY